jgi:hypothetical protein
MPSWNFAPSGRPESKSLEGAEFIRAKSDRTSAAASGLTRRSDRQS